MHKRKTEERKEQEGGDGGEGKRGGRQGKEVEEGGRGEDINLKDDEKREEQIGKTGKKGGKR